MTLVFKDRVMETSFTKGTAAYQLNGAIPGYQTFVAVGDGNTCYYAATDGIGWEVGEGTYSNTARTLSRDTILASSNAGSAVSWLATPKSVWVDFPASLASYFGAGTTGTGALVLQDSPELTGVPTAPTAALGTNTTQIATTAFVLANGGGVNVADRTALAALSTSNAVAWLEEAGRQGTFQWNSANLSTEVTVDTAQGVYVPPSSDPTGASGAWVRQYDGPLVDTWFGLPSDAVMLAQLTFAITYGVPLLTIQDYSLTTIDISTLTGALVWTIHGTLTQAAAQSAAMINFGSNTKTSVLIDGEGIGVIDGNQANQTSWSADGLYFGIVDLLVIKNLTFQNAKKTGLDIDAPCNRVLVQGCTFKDGAVASGTVDQYCTFLRCRGGISVTVRQNRFVQTLDPVGTAVRQPAGFSMINTGATTIQGTFIIEENFFSNLGLNTNSSGNLLAPCDFYSISDTVIVRGNYFEKSRYIPIRVCHGRNQIIEGNFIDQGVPLLFDGGGTFLGAACIFAGATDRGYLLDSNDAYAISIKNNSVITYNNINASGISVSNTSGSNAYVRSTVLEGNALVCLDTNSYYAIDLNGLYNATVVGGWVNAFSQGVRAINTSLSAPISTELYTTCVVKGLRISGCATGVYAALNVANMNLTVESCDMTGVTNQSVLVASALNVRVKGNNLGGNAGQVTSCASFYYEDNNAGISSDPTSYTTNTYYRLKNNVGRNDRASIDFNLGAPSASTIPTVSGNTGDIVFNSAPAHSGFIGWVCLGGTSWTTFGAIT